jgi:hypothetical protein
MTLNARSKSMNPSYFRAPFGLSLKRVTQADNSDAALGSEVGFCIMITDTVESRLVLTAQIAVPKRRPATDYLIWSG